MPKFVGDDHFVAKVKVEESLFNILDGFPEDLAIMITSQQIINITGVEENVFPQGSGASFSNMYTHDLLKLTCTGGIPIGAPREEQDLERGVQISWINRIKMESGSVGSF